LVLQEVQLCLVCILINHQGVSMSFFLKISASVILILSMTACQKSANTESTAKSGAIETVATQSAVPQQSVPTKGKNGVLSVTPGSLASCESAVVVTIGVDLGDSHPETKSVSIFLKGFDEKESKLFGAVGRKVSIQTGAWIRPGHQISIEDSDTHAVIDDVVVSGPQCQ